MNLNMHPTKEQLRDLLRNHDDSANHHIIWVDNDGEVHIDQLNNQISPASFTESLSGRMRFRLETFSKGKGYVGLDAAQSDPWVDQLYSSLIDLWGRNETGYHDVF